MDASNFRHVNVSVAAAVVAKPNGGIQLRERCGTMACDDAGEEYELSTAAVDGAPIVRLPDGRFVVSGWFSLANGAAAAARRCDEATECQRRANGRLAGEPADASQREVVRRFRGGAGAASADKK